MTNVEAIIRIRDHMKIHKMHEPQAIFITEALDMASEALEKQIPKNPFYTADDDTCLYFHYECPVCGARLSKGILKYCGECGQHICWEEGEQDDK